MKNYEQINIKQKQSESDPFTKERYRQFYSFFPKQTIKVLDVGCNTGRGGELLKELDKHLILSGLDIVQERLDKLPKDIFEKRIHGSCTEIPSRDEEFDVIIAGEFIEHLYAVDVDKTLFEMFRVLRIGGRLLLTTPNPGDLKRKARKQSILGNSHVSQHHHDALKIKMRMAGFSNVRVYGSGKVSRYLGYRFPMLCIYGSYLIMGDKF
jgi:ubiquinone/menaquinone biosynthesis C-methylase UbiE